MTCPKTLCSSSPSLSFGASSTTSEVFNDSAVTTALPRPLQAVLSLKRLFCHVLRSAFICSPTYSERTIQQCRFVVVDECVLKPLIDHWVCTRCLRVVLCCCGDHVVQFGGVVGGGAGGGGVSRAVPEDYSPYVSWCGVQCDIDAE